MKRARCEDLLVYYKLEKIEDDSYVCSFLDYKILGIGSSEQDAIVDARRKLLDLICYEYFPEASGMSEVSEMSKTYTCITHTEIQTYIKKNKAFHAYSCF